MKNQIKWLITLACVASFAVLVAVAPKATAERIAWTGTATNITIAVSTNVSPTVVSQSMSARSGWRTGVYVYNQSASPVYLKFSGTFTTNATDIAHVTVPATDTVYLNLGDGFNGEITARSSATNAGPVITWLEQGN